MSDIIVNRFINENDLFKHEEEVCNDVKCSDCPFSDGAYCEWKMFLNGLPRYRVAMRGEE